MRFQMRQKVFAFGDDFTIQDEAGNEVFAVDSQGFSLGHKLALLDPQGNERAFISQPAFSFGTTYEIHRDGALLAVVTKPPFQFFKSTFDIEGPGLTVEGDFLGLDYRFTRGETTVAQVSKEYFSFTDTYGVDVADTEDVALILATCVVIDLACHSNES